MQTQIQQEQTNKQATQHKRTTQYMQNAAQREKNKQTINNINEKENGPTRTNASIKQRRKCNQTSAQQE